MTSSRPYLVRAMYQWISDNGMTPHLLVDVAIDGVQVPEEHVQNGKIILNIAPMAVTALVLGDDEVSFSARFSGKSRELYVPIDAVLAVYAKENGQGMMFSADASHSRSRSRHTPVMFNLWFSSPMTCYKPKRLLRSWGLG